MIPNNLRLSATDSVHTQWTGSDSQNKGAGGGDEQAGDEGQGQEDRFKVIKTKA